MSASEVMWFGVSAIICLSIIQMARILKGGMFSATYARLFGFLAIATFGCMLAVSTISADSRAAAYGLLGTIAGYLAGSRESSGPDPKDQV